MITAELKGVPELTALLRDITDSTRKKMPALCRQAAYFAVRSAIKATGPGTGSRISALPQKYKYRPIEKIFGRKGLMRGKFLYKLANGRFWSTDLLLSAASMQKRGISRVDRGILKWDKRSHGWAYLPYLGTKTGRFDAEAKGGKIPHSGAAKAGWLRALPKLGKPGGDNIPAETGRDHTRVEQRTTDSGCFIGIFNDIDYVSAVGPESAQRGIDSALEIMRHTYLPQLSQELQNKWKS